uniref:Fibronectin type-III domain-containing protein n=1 Tax=Heterorhabditis bacteriophora TaxID=37862 RepID=A0A1I7XFP6_HETBA
MTPVWIIYVTVYFCIISAQSFLDQDPLEIMDVRNDAVTIQWHPPQDTVNQTTKQRLMITVVRSSLQTSKSSVTVNVNSETQMYTFTNLNGNTTYRVSVEAFEKDVSLWYASNMVTTSLASLTWLPPPTDITLLDKTNTSLEISWMVPVIQDTLHSAIINQHLVTVYEFLPVSKLLTKKFSVNIPVPKTTYSISRLSPGCVYNITLQAGTNYGYGNMGWAVFSTLEKSEEEFILKQRSKTPNSLTLIWPTQWLPSANAKFTIRAKTLHSPDNIEKEIMNSGVGESGKQAEFVLRNLHPGSTYNVSITTFVAGVSENLSNIIC